MRLVEDGLLAKHVGEAGDATGADALTGDCAAAVGQGSYRLLDFVVVGVAAEGAIAGAKCAVEREIELVLVVGIVGGARVVVGGGGEVGGRRKACEEGHGRGIEGHIDDVVRKFLANIGCR